LIPHELDEHLKPSSAWLFVVVAIYVVELMKAAKT
jgi:hypothetical protein